MQNRVTREPAGLGESLAVIDPGKPSGPASQGGGDELEASVASERRGQTGGPNPAALLAQLMDFPGGMKLAEYLEQALTDRERHPQANELGERLERDVEARLEALERNSMAPLVGTRAPALPTGEELVDAYMASGLAAVVEDAAFLRFSQMTGERLLGAVAASLRQGEVQVATLRWEVQNDLRALGPDAERIERLDALIHTATQAEVRKLFGRVELALRETWTAASKRALSELPEAPVPTDFEPWIAPDGWLERFRERCVSAARAVFVHQRKNLAGVVRAAVIAEES
jgi:hypothetical protein